MVKNIKSTWKNVEKGKLVDSIIKQTQKKIHEENKKK